MLDKRIAEYRERSDQYPSTKMTSTKATATEHRNPLWQYQDARGVEHIGHTAGSYDHGGTDVGLFLRDCETGEFTVLSGSRYKNATRLWQACPQAQTVEG